MQLNPRYAKAHAYTASSYERKEASKRIEKILRKRKRNKKDIMSRVYNTINNVITNNRKRTNGRDYMFIPGVHNGRLIHRKHSIKW